MKDTDIANENADDINDHDDMDELSDVERRVEKVMQQQELMAVEKAEDETQQQQKRQRAELADYRTKILKAVKTEAPDLAAPLFEKLNALSYENHEFASREVVDLLKAHKARFKDEPDFFDLGIAQREDLLDRIGFYRGIVVDHTLSNPVEVGFRDVLMRPEAGAAEHDDSDAQILKAANVFSRKPNFSGYFENYYTTSEAIFQTQKNGVTNLNVSLSAAGGGLSNSFALGASLTSYGRQEESKGFVGKTVFTTANFYLPKIELSFDHTEVCASTAFRNACEKAVNDPDKKRSLETKFRQLKRVLDDFGHFVALQTLVGGRLFATEKKQFEGAEHSADFTDRFGAGVKASLSSVMVDAEAGVRYEKSTQEAEKNKNASEMQTMTFNAVGGEGTVVQDAAAWAESLYDYRRWATVQRENLIPSIRLLPEPLAGQCWQLLARFCQNRTKPALLHEENAWFLFCGEYGEKAGKKARDVFFSIQNYAHDAAITANTISPSEGEHAVLIKPETVSSQLWRMTENGEIVLRATNRKTTHGKTSDILFALTAEVPAGSGSPTEDQYAVTLRQLNKDVTQTWDYPGSGELICRALGPDYVLDAITAEELVLRKRTAAGRQSRLWYLAEVPSSVEKKLKVRQEDQWVQIFTQKEDAVLSVVNAEQWDEINGNAPYQVVAQPNIGGLHQIWRKEESGRFVSALQIKMNSSAQPLLLSSLNDSDRLIASPFKPYLAHKWSVTAAGKLTPKTGAYADKTVMLFRPQEYSASGGVLILSNSESKADQQLIIRAVSDPYEKPKTFMVSSHRETEEKCPIHYVEETPLRVTGAITGIELFLNHTQNSSKEYALRLRVFCAGEGNKEDIVHHGGYPSENLSPLRVDKRKTYIDPRFLYLPSKPIFSLKLDASDVSNSARVLTLKYQLEKDGQWYGFAENDAPYGQNALTPEDLIVSMVPTRVDAGFTLKAIGIDFASANQAIAPKILIEKVVS